MLTFEQIKELIELVAIHRLTGVEIERSGFRLKIDGLPAVPSAAPAVTYAAPSASFLAPAPLPATGPEPAAAAGPGTSAGPGTGAAPAAGAAPAGAKASPHEGAHIITSPIVGTFYRAPSPEASPFVEVGSRVQKGQVLCIIEAMKLMNEIESDVAGEVVAILPQNAQAVEFAEPLFAIKAG